jgi:hypothetical protein
MPYLGVPFRRVKNLTEDIELLILVTPELVAATDCADSPKCLPSMHTDTPNDCQFYLKGYTEVPSVGPCGPHGCPAGGPPAEPYRGPTPAAETPGAYESVLPAAPVPPAAEMPRPGSSRNAAATASAMPSIAATPAAPPAPPMSANPSNAASRYNLQAPQNPHNQRGANPPQTGPDFIGPVGYDVLN